MKRTNTLLLIFITVITVFCQQYGSERQQYSADREPVPQYLLDQYNNAKETFNEPLKLSLTLEIEKYLPVPVGNELINVEPLKPVQPPFNPDWYAADVTVHTGDVSYQGGFRQVDLKQGEDGNMYLAINRRNSGNNGNVLVYRSTNGGAAWTQVQGFITTWYVQSISMLVENRSSNNSNPDSTRILIYFCQAPASNFNDAMIGLVSFRRNGSAWYSASVGSPPAGNKFEYVSACSDGAYWTTATYMHCVARQATNAGTNVGLRHFYSTTWGASHTGALISTGYDDRYPSVQYGEKNGSDSIYIAVERRFDANSYGLRLVAIPEFASNSNHFVYFVAYTAGVRYEKPEIALVQQHYTVPKKILLTCTRARNPRFFYSANGGQSWTIDLLMGPSSTCTADYTTCNSDTLTSGGQYVIMGYVSDDGDSVTVKQTNIPPTSTFTYYKKNSHTSTGLVAPSTAIFKSGSTKYASFAYPGLGPTNVYYNAEQLITGINIISNIAETYSLLQNYPNPFNPNTNINFSIPKQGNVKLVVYDVMGKEVSVIINTNLQQGTYSINFDGSGLASGVYFYKLTAGDYSDVKKMLLVK